MSTQFFLPNPISQQRLRVGPLAADLDGFATRLKAEGYARKSAMIKLRLVGHLSRWLQHQGLDTPDAPSPFSSATKSTFCSGRRTPIPARDGATARC